MEAPLHSDLAGAPEGGRAFWVRASDGVRLRIAIWGGQSRGTVLILPGRAEYIEKYGLVAGRLRDRGLNCAVIDFRGQGLSDRLARDTQAGYVRHFADYQRDLDALFAFPPFADLPGPRILLGHSMGGAIAYRALSEGVAVEAAILTGAMFELAMKPWQKPLLILLSRLAVLTGQGLAYLPSTSAEPYVLRGAFEGNTLTSSEADFERLRKIAETRPEMVIGGPSLTWISAAMRESAALRRMPVPRLPVLSLVGGDETLVRTDLIARFADRMPNCDLVEFPDARHEVLVETPEIQDRVWKAIDEFLALVLVEERDEKSG